MVLVLWDTLRVEIVQKSVFQNLIKSRCLYIFIFFDLIDF